ncbi:MAG: RICIN domain-containing protein [Ruminococcus flavefaciens]|nr:RICIN domain-containing protein [Ruminococcus flavefaciens]MCM1229489.1 RICIN domain-containing protein [Ruminococcus flavefaciens]
MKFSLKRFASAMSALVVASTCVAVPKAAENLSASAVSNVTLEYLDRGISAINTGNGMLVSWRYLANDDDNAVYKLYRDGSLIYTSEAGQSTCYLDSQGSASSKYRVDTLSGGKVVGSEDCKLISDNAYFDIALDPPKAGSDYTYSPNDMSVGDIDGDGQYELFLKWDPSNSQDNSKDGVTGNVYIDCIRLDGTRVWRIDLGKNIRAGAHYTQFYVADFDLDGKAEMTCKTADGTVDGTGKVIGDASKDYRNSAGRILDGPEYYTLFDGATGAALDTVDYVPERGEVSKKTWGDDYGNRVDRFWGTVAYVDGVHPCVVTGRGYYTRLSATCYGVENKKLVQKWAYDTGHNSTAVGYGDGNHNSMPADVDSDGKQEIVNGPTCIDDDGTILWNTDQGHGDAMHLADLDPTRDGLELWICHEEEKSGYGVSYIDAKTGEIIFHIDADKDTGRCAADNISAKNPGAELWGARPAGVVLDTNGNTISGMSVPAMNFFSYWDGDLEREILDGGDNKPATITKMNDNGKISTLLTTDGCLTNNSTKGNPCLSADIFGDWREELIVRTADNNGIRIYATPYDTDYRITTLMHDAQYRMQVSSQNTSYNQPPHPSFFLGTGYDLPARPTDTVNMTGVVTKPSKQGAEINTGYTYRIKNKNSGLYLEVADSKAENGANVQQGTTGATGWTFVESETPGYYYIYSELGDGKTFLLDLDYGKVENGTNIGIWGNTDSDAQLFKLVDNGDGTYAICTKVTDDNSGIGVTSASKDSGANVIEWECSDSDDQKWTLEIKVEAIDGNLVKGLEVKDIDNYQDWKIDTSAQVGDLVFGDRDVTYTKLPESLIGAEMIQTACDSKNSDSDLAVFTSDKDVKVYVALDTRVESSMGAIPEWLNGWTKTGEQAENSGDVTFDIYEKSYKAGETVTLGTNSTNYSVVNYTVFIKEDKAETVVTTTETTATTTTTTTETTAVPSGKYLCGDANEDGVVDVADAAAIIQSLGNKDKYALSEQGAKNADCYNPGDGVTGMDALAIQRLKANMIDSLPELS